MVGLIHVQAKNQCASIRVGDPRDMLFKTTPCMHRVEDKVRMSRLRRAVRSAGGAGAWHPANYANNNLSPTLRYIERDYQLFLSFIAEV